jgi:DNA-binding LytR/AlgR family response regulator
MFLGVTYLALFTDFFVIHVDMEVIDAPHFFLFFIPAVIISVVVSLLAKMFYQKQTESIDDITKRKVQIYLIICAATAGLALLTNFLMSALTATSSSHVVAGMITNFAFIGFVGFAITTLIKHKVKEADLKKKEYYTQVLESMVADIQTDIILELKLTEGTDDYPKGSMVHLNVSDILYIESTAANPHHIYVNTQTSEYVARMSLMQAEQKVGKGFIRCHKSFIVSATTISSYHPTDRKLTLSTGQTIDVGRKYTKDISGIMKQRTLG